MEGCPSNVQVRTTKVDGETYFWPDSSSKDYIHRPTSLEGLCSYEMAMHYKKVLKPKSAIKESFNLSSNTTDTENDQDDLCDASDCGMCESTPTGYNYEFLMTQPGYCFTNLSKLKNWVVPMMYYDGV